MESYSGVSVFMFSLLFAVSIVVVMALCSDRSISLIDFSVFSLNNIISTDELHRTVSSSDQIFSVDAGGSISYNSFTNQTRNTTLVRKIKRLGREQALERGLARARASILNAVLSRNVSVTTRNDGDIPAGEVYRNPTAFYQSYLEMEKIFKVYIYTEGELPIVHDGPCKDLYTTEGRFIQEMEHGSGTSRFRTKNPYAAHVYFMPFSVAWMVKYIYRPTSFDIKPLKQFVSDYVKVVSTKYPFWNRTNGADHFMLACHDWGPHTSKANPFLYNTSIRVLCNANTSEGFNPRKDVSLPEISLYGGELVEKLRSPPPLNAPRPHLGFFAGGLHGPVRPILLQHWKGRDNDMLVYEYLPKDQDYYSLMLQSRFCLCPSGYEVASPRVVEAIFSDCVPVILSVNYVLPFSDVLKWEAFSVQVDVSEIPRLKEILLAVPEEKYRRLKANLRLVRRHFELNQPAKRFDLFHMILHSVWLRRINTRLLASL